MGAVQKLATVVIIGLVALATVLTVYIAREPARRDSEADEQEEVAIVRGTDLYITYCLQCHGPAGLGSLGNEDPARIGAALNQDGAGIPEDSRNVNFQSDDPVAQQAAEEWIRYRIEYGIPSEPIETEKLMPAFAQDLNEEQVNELVTLVLSDSWDYVYNTAVTQTGETVAQAECDATPVPGEQAETAEYCDNIEEAPPVYPTAPPPEEAEEDAEAGEDSGEEGDTDEAAGGAAVQLEAADPYEWSQDELIVAPGDTIEITNVGFSQHDFTVDELGIAEDLPSEEPVTITIPEDAEPGEYEFYCSVPGHAQNGMVGTLIIEAP